jgi:hypothetical protein
VRIDTEATYGSFVCERAVEEIARRVDELRALVEAHLADGHGPEVKKLARWRTDIIGAAESVADLRNAESPRDALRKMPAVPLNLPPFAEGKIDCWRDGDHVICSIRFLAADGGKRVATMAAKPRADVDEAAKWALESGVEPAAVLGALEDVTSVVCGQRLVQDVAGAALRAHERFDVCGMEEADEEAEPLVLVGAPEEGTAPLAALMYLEQRAQAGDLQAQRERELIERAAKTPSGRKIAAPLIEEARARLGAGRQRQAKETRMEKYALMGMCL